MDLRNGVPNESLQHAKIVFVSQPSENDTYVDESVARLVGGDFLARNYRHHHNVLNIKRGTIESYLWDTCPSLHKLDLVRIGNTAYIDQETSERSFCHQE